MIYIVGAYALLFSAALTVCALPLFGILQQEGYCGRALLRWYYRKGNMLRRRYRLLALCLFLATALLGLCFSSLGAVYAEIIEAAAFLGLCALYIFAFRYALKVPVRFTRRLVRLLICNFVLLFALMFGAGVGLYFAAEGIAHDLSRALRMAPVAIFPLLLFLVAALANLVMKVYEVPRSRALIKRAKKLLKESSCVKVGITGSFGKTSVKHIAAAILSAKYRVKATPASYNTPIGIAKFVNEEGCDCDFFLAEMGARRVGDIKELCEMVHPTVGIVTGVCSQHLETFSSLDNIRREKGELARFVEMAVLGTSCAGMREDAMLEGREFAAENVTIFSDRTTFILRIGEERVDVETSLLGRHAAEDIALAAALCHALGMTVGEIAAVIPTLAPVPHRLQRTVSGGVTILDDSYNSNAEGAKSAIEVLALSAGKKVVITPGLVELGEMEEEENAALGRSLAVADVLILVGETRVLAVRRGFLEGGGREESLRMAPTLDDAKDLLNGMLQVGDTVLFLNDLPDKY